MSALWGWAELVEAAGGRADGEAPAAEITGLSIDSRSIAAGEVFIALKDQRDGHDFVTNAFAAGAAAAIVEEGYQRRPGDGPLVRVPETLEALRSLARAARARLSPDARVVAVTGSVGKTTTKEMLRAAFSRLGPTHAADKSFNNHWGVPLTLARMPRDTRFAAIEIGMNHAGEITPLTELARPHVAIVTTVQPVHLENFESVAGIAAAKAEIFAGLEPGGVAILPYDNEHVLLLREAALARGAEIRTFSADHWADGSEAERAQRAALGEPDLFTNEERSYDHGERMAVTAFGAAGSVDYSLSLIGYHNVANSLAVVLALEAAGGDLAQALPGLASMPAPEGRGERVMLNVGDGQVLLLDESYNANPASMRAAITLLGWERAAKRRIALLGDMLELGPQERAFHEELAEPLSAAGVNVVFCCGKRMRWLHEALPEAMRGGWSETPEGALDALQGLLAAGDAVMIKGSNGSKVWQVAKALKTAQAAAPKSE